MEGFAERAGLAVRAGVRGLSAGEGHAALAGKNSKCGGRGQSTVGPGAALPELIILLAAPTSKKEALCSRAAGTHGRGTKLAGLAEQLNTG